MRGPTTKLQIYSNGKQVLAGAVEAPSGSAVKAYYSVVSRTQSKQTQKRISASRSVLFSVANDTAW